ncbi:MAG TPA: hypothetical protein VLG40_05060 [Candidatus Saccharimonas sp.]|nr:hypothetical protein [Candidatus Saccharimonas sp.]
MPESPTVRLPADIGIAALYTLAQHLNTEAAVASPNQLELRQLFDTVNEWYKLFRDKEQIAFATSYCADAATAAQRVLSAVQNVERIYRRQIDGNPESCVIQQVLAAAKQKVPSGQGDSDGIKEVIQQIFTDLEDFKLFLLLLNLELLRDEKPIASSLAALKATSNHGYNTNKLLALLLEFMVRDSTRGAND